MRALRRVLLCLAALCCAPGPAAADPVWRAGVATAVITPEQSLWMAGYGNRDHPVKGKLHDLRVKVLALEAADGHRVVVLTSDLLGIPQSIYGKTLRTLKARHALAPADVMLTSSHTHCGPVLSGALSDIYPLDDRQVRMIADYSARLERQIVDCVDAALADLSPARLSAGQGTTGFAVNRRNNREPEVPRLREQNRLAGPVDHAVPVLAVRSLEGELRAVVFGYACHNTTLSFYQWCGDYAGFAQIELEQRHPGAVAMFYMGCGADQNPLPRRTVELCQKYGRLLADAVEAVLEGGGSPVVTPLSELEPTIETAYELVELDLGLAPGREELETLAAEASGYRQRWAARLLKQLEAGEPFRRTYLYPVQVWRLGGRQMWISLGGEVVVDYALAFKKTYGEGIWVTGYANDVMAYVPSLRVLREGGYEGASSMMVYGLPAHRWHESIEERITSAVDRLAGQVTGARP